MMTVTEKSVIKTEAIFSADKQYRYLLRKEWDKNKKKVLVIMINPSTAAEVFIDHTTMYVINNLSKLDFGAVDIVNLFPNIDGSRKTKGSIPEVDNENEKQIAASAEKADSIIIAWGSVGENNKNIQERQGNILNMLSHYEDKLFSICDDRGNSGFHPLSPKIRYDWNLIKLCIKSKEEKKQDE
ncbi:DUF1643 domain-containing protein [Pelosinus fermentans]|nr:DUF1643 domain-containing protein [Pelosinus fermentans]